MLCDRFSFEVSCTRVFRLVCSDTNLSSWCDRRRSPQPPLNEESMQKIRFASLAILSLSIGLMTAGDSTSSSGNAPTISSPIVAKDASGNTIDNGTTLTTSTTGHLTGTVTDVASWIWVVKNASGNAVDTLVP